VGKLLADAEWTFGTCTQRFLSFVDYRMHYGHPDFIDAFWASNRGSVSKASPAINLSEDIFFGFGVKLRKQKSKHTDVLEWEKGREVQFLACSELMWKFASGNVGVMRSRDMKQLCQENDIFGGSFMLYFATTAWYLHQVLVDFSAELYVKTFIYLTLAGVKLEELGALNSILATEWLLTPGVVSMLPGILCFGMEYGVKRLFTDYLPAAPGSMLFFCYINKSMSSSVRTTVVENEAAYVNTGRPHANNSYTLLQAFDAARKTHYNPGVAILGTYLVYFTNNYLDGFLPMALILILPFIWTCTPVLFAPPHQDSLPNQLLELAQYIVFHVAPRESPPKYRENATNRLSDAVLNDELAAAKRQPLMLCFRSLIPTVAFIFMSPAVVYDHLPPLLFGLLVHLFAILFMWRFFGRQETVSCCAWLLPIFSIAVIIGASPAVPSNVFNDIGTTTIAIFVLNQWGRTVKYFAWWAIKKHSDWFPEGTSFEDKIKAMHRSLPTFFWHFLAAMTVLIIQAVLVLLLWLVNQIMQLLGKFFSSVPTVDVKTWYLLGRYYKPGNLKEIYAGPGQQPARGPRRGEAREEELLVLLRTEENEEKNRRGERGEDASQGFRPRDKEAKGCRLIASLMGFVASDREPARQKKR
jgi:hypothetical protein